MSQGVNFTNPDDLKVMSAGVSITDNSGSSNIKAPAKEGISFLNLAQSHHFTIQIEKFNMSYFKTPEGTFSEFLPVKSMNYNYVSYENMSIPLSIFGDFPLLNKKRVTTIALTCYDLDDNKLEHELKSWENACFPKGRYVAYMEDIVRKLTYRGYDVKGKETLKHDIYVIPTGNVGVSRDYSANDAKLLVFSLVCVGDGSTCATGSGKVVLPNQKISDVLR